MDTLDDVDADDDVDAELDVDALKKKFFFCYHTNYGVYFYSFSKEPGNVNLCSPANILCTLDCIGCKNVFNFPKS